MNKPITLATLSDLPPTLDLMTAARLLGIGRTKAYHLARHDQFPCRIIRLGGSYLIPTVELLRELGIEPIARKPIPH